MPTLGSLTAIFDADTKRFDAGVRGVQTKITGVTKDLNRATQTTNQFSGSLAPARTGLTGMAGALTVAAGASVVAASAFTATIAGVVKLATFSQELGGEIFDLSGKINFSAETLSSLKVAAELSGGSLASLSTSLGIFDRNMEEAKEIGSEMAGVFKILKIETDDNEKALRRAFVVLNDLEGGAQQTAIAMKLFGRSGKEVLGIIKETGGSIDAYIEKMREMGLEITTSGSQKADKFGDELKLLQLKLEAVARQIGQELVPTVSKAADDISGWLKQNQGEIVKTAKEVGSLISSLYTLAKVIAELSPQVMVVRIVRQFEGLAEGSRRDAEAAAARGFGTKSGSAARARWQMDAGEFVSPGSTVPQAPKPAPIVFPSRGGGGGGAKAQKDILESLKSTLMGLNAEFRKFDTELLASVNLTALAAEKEKLLTDVMSSLNAATKMKIAGLKNVDEALEAAIGSLPAKSQAAARALLEQNLAQFKLNETTRIAGELTVQAEELSKEWRQEIENAISGADEYTRTIQRLEAAYRRYGAIIPPTVRLELEQQATMLRLIEIGKQFADVMRDAAQSGLEALEHGRAMQDLMGAGMKGGVLEGADVIKKQMDDLRDQMRSLASEIVSVLDHSIYEGITGGFKRGLVTLTIGILDIVKNIFLRQLEAALTDALIGLRTGSGGGSWLTTLLGVGVSAVAGGLGGGIGGGKGGIIPGVGGKAFASGGFLGAGQWGIAGEYGPESIYGGRTGMTVIPNKSQSTQVTINLMPHFHANQNGQFSKQSADQMMSQLLDRLSHVVERGS